MKNKKILRALALLLSCVFFTSEFLSNTYTYAKSLSDYSIHNSGILGIGGSWDYQKNDDGEDTITLVKCKTANEGKLTSPIDSHTVTRIGENFSFIKRATNHHVKETVMLMLLTIPAIITLVGIMALAPLAEKSKPEDYDVYSNIVSVDLPECISVGENGLKNSKKLVTVNLPNCKTIGKRAFEGCDELKSINLPACDSISEGAFYKNGKLESFTASKNYKVVDNNTFEECSKLKKFGNAEIVEKLGNRSFYRTNFESLSLSSCKHIGNECFSGCINLCNVELPVCESMGNRVFYGIDRPYGWRHTNRWGDTEHWCEKLKSIYLPMCKSVGHQCFSKTSIQEIDFPMCENIGNQSFSGCEMLKNVKLPLCKSVGEYAFSVQNNNIPTDWSSFKEWSCSNLKSVYLPQCSSIGKGAFEGCKSLEEIDIPMCEDISPYMFKGCSKINNGLKISNNVKKVSAGAFENCQSLEKISLDNCKVIEDEAFKNCSKLSSLSLPNCESLGSNVFENCSKLETVYLPNCKKIENNAFQGCSSIRNITVAEGCQFEQNAIPIDKLINGHVKIIHHNQVVTKLTEEKFQNSIVEDSVKEKIPEDKEFYQIDDNTGIRVHAPAGVFPANSHILVKKLEHGSKNNDLDDNYKKAVENLDKENKKKIEKINLYSVKVVDDNSNVLQPNGEVTIMLPVPENFNENDLEALRIMSGKDTSFSSNIVEIDGKKYCAFVTDHFSIYGLIDKLTVEDFIKHMVPYLIVYIILGISVAIYFILKKRALKNRI